MYKPASKYNYLLGIVVNTESLNNFLNKIIVKDELNIPKFNDTYISNEKIEYLNKNEIINNSLSNIYIKNIKSIFNENTNLESDIINYIISPFLHKDEQLVLHKVDFKYKNNIYSKFSNYTRPIGFLYGSPFQNKYILGFKIDGHEPSNINYDKIDELKTKFTNLFYDDYKNSDIHIYSIPDL